MNVKLSEFDPGRCFIPQLALTLLRLAWWVIPNGSLRNLTSATVRAERLIRPLPVMTSKSVILLLRLHNVAHTVYLCGQSVHGMPAILTDELALRSGSKHGSWGYDSLFSQARSFGLRFARFWSRDRPTAAEDRIRWCTRYLIHVIPNHYKI